MIHSLAKDEVLRAQALDRYEILGSPPDPALADITRLAAQICGCSVAAISLIANDAVYLQATIGPIPPIVSRGVLPCEITVLGDDVYEIPDARYHRDYAPDGIVAQGRAYRFYAGAPLITPDGVAMGTLFVADGSPRQLTMAQRDALLVLGRQVMTRLELTSRIRLIDRDSRARHRVETALTVERNFVSAVLDTVGALVAVFDTAGRIVRFNRTCETVSGYDFPTLVGHYLWEKLIPTEDVPEAIESFERLRGGQFPVNFENRWCSSDGSLRRIAWSATALVDAQGQVNFIIATGIDVTLQREAEATLRESEARYRQLIEGSLGMVYTHDLEGVILSMNSYGAESLGRTVDEMKDQNLSSFMAPEQHQALADYLKQVASTGEAQGQLRMLDRQQGEHVIVFRNKLIDIGGGIGGSIGAGIGGGIDGKPPYVLGFGVDITEQVRAEDQVRALIHQSDSILQSVGDGIYAFDLDGRITVVNPAASQMLGYTAEELLGQRAHDLFHHHRADGSVYPLEECPILGAIHSTDTVRMSDEVFWRKDGTSFPVEYVARPQFVIQPDTQTQKAIGGVVAFSDITEHRALDRMKDEFISTVSHELRTPLTSLRAALGLVTGGALATRPEKMQQMLEIAIGNTDRLVRLVNDILDIERIGSGKAELHSVTTSAEDLLRRAVELQQAGAAKGGYRFRILSDGVSVWADPDRILQTLANLISNAMKFSSEGSEITLSAHRIDGGHAQLEVRDYGRGIPEDKLEQIFERFQQVDASDSRERGGTGLGLAICRSIVLQHGGRIWASSTPGKGTTFHFTLPTQPSGRLT